MSIVNNYPLKRLVLSHSSRSMARSCMRKLEFAKMYGDNRAARDNSFAADVGNALHRGFQNFLTFKDEDRAHVAMMMAYPHEDEYADAKNKMRSLETCYATLSQMIRSPIPEKYELVWIKHEGVEKPAVEVPFAIEIVGMDFPVPVFFVGFIDAILLEILTQMIAVNDIKTTRMFLTDMSARFEFDEQTVPYGIVLEHLLGRVVDSFDVTYLSTFVDLMGPTVSMYKFTKTRDHIHDWVRGLVDDLLRIKKYMERGWFPRATNGETCMAFNRGCQFLEYCTFRDPITIAKMLDCELREGLFHDGQVPWVSVQLDVGEYV